MGAFEQLHQNRVAGSLAMFDRMIFKGRLTGLHKENGAKRFLWDPPRSPRAHLYRVTR